MCVSASFLSANVLHVLLGLKKTTETTLQHIIIRIQGIGILSLPMKTKRLSDTTERLCSVKLLSGRSHVHVLIRTNHSRVVSVAP